MAYQNPGTPRFYINDFSYAKSIAHDLENTYKYNTTNSYLRDHLTIEDYYKLIDGDPTNLCIIDTSSTGRREYLFMYNLPKKRTDKAVNYLAFLNHNFSDAKSHFHVRYIDEEGSSNGTIPLTEILNANIDEINIWQGSSSNWGRPNNNGISIYGLNGGTQMNSAIDDVYQFRFYLDNDDFGQTGNGNSSNGESPGATTKLQIGSMFMGRYYDMPHSPELDVTMTIENDGFDSITTQGGAHLTNIKYNGNPNWEREEGFFTTMGGDTTTYDATSHPAWTIGEPTAVGRRRGRRVWSMNFKYLSSQDLFASNYMSNTYIQDGNHSSNDDYNTNDDLVTDRSAFEYTLEDDDSFVAQVLNKVGNGQRFIFQPDNTNNNPDQFAICQLDQDSLNIKQVANGIYDISLKVREVW